MSDAIVDQIKRMTERSFDFIRKHQKDFPRDIDISASIKASESDLVVNFELKYNFAVTRRNLVVGPDVYGDSFAFGNRLSDMISGALSEFVIKVATSAKA